jgi:purine-binding chemotaxis protein CheW
MGATFSSTWASTDGATDDAASEADASVQRRSARLLVFVVADRRCACEITAVREIVAWRSVTRLPGAPPSVAGLINLRGGIVTVLDLGVHLGGAPANRTTGSIVLAESGSKTVGLAVDTLHDVCRVSLEDIEAAESERFSETGSDIVRGVLRAGDSMAVMLDLGRIITSVLA